MANHSITTIAILTTNDCTANCDFCKFKSDGQGEYLSFDIMADYIDIVTKQCAAKVCVFTGGEPFLGIRTLTQAIEYASRRGLITRVVTNGYWANSLERANESVKELVNAGLNEINLSTGYYHSQWVPVENIVNAAKICVDHDLTTVINIEQTHIGDAFNAHFADLLVKETVEGTRKRIRLTLCEVVDFSCIFKDPVSRSINNGKCYIPCKHILDTVALLPTKEVSLCCGFAVNDNKWLKYPIPRTDGILDLIEYANSIPLFKYLKYIGPRKLFEESVLALNNELTYNKECSHPCYYCYLLGQYLITSSNFSNILNQDQLIQTAIFESVLR